MLCAVKESCLIWQRGSRVPISSMTGFQLSWSSDYLKSNIPLSFCSFSFIFVSFCFVVFLICCSFLVFWFRYNRSVWYLEDEDPDEVREGCNFWLLNDLNFLEASGWCAYVQNSKWGYLYFLDYATLITVWRTLFWLLGVEWEAGGFSLPSSLTGVPLWCSPAGFISKMNVGNTGPKWSPEAAQSHNAVGARDEDGPGLARIGQAKQRGTSSKRSIHYEKHAPFSYEGRRR